VSVSQSESDATVDNTPDFRVTLPKRRNVFKPLLFAGAIIPFSSRLTGLETHPFLERSITVRYPMKILRPIPFAKFDPCLAHLTIPRFPQTTTTTSLMMNRHWNGYRKFWRLRALARGDIAKNTFATAA
jgi:hypothetical protein